MKTLGATEAKTHFLSLLNDVEQKREGLIVTRNGKPVARVLPMPDPDRDTIYGFYRGKLDIRGDVLSPLYSDEELEEFFERSSAQYK